MRSAFIGAREEFSDSTPGLTQAQADVRYVRLSPTVDQQTIQRDTAAAAVLLVTNQLAAHTGNSQVQFNAGSGSGSVGTYGVSSGATSRGGLPLAGRTYVQAASTGGNARLILDGALNALRIDGDIQFGEAATPRTASASTHTLQVFDSANTPIFLLASLVQ